MNLILIITLFSVNLGLWYLAWTQMIDKSKNWLSIIILVLAYVITMDVFLQHLEEYNISLFMKLIIFLIYLVSIVPVFKKQITHQN
jgi:hypothetical protein